MKTKLYFALTALFLSGANLIIAQNKTWLGRDPFYDRAFIENKGQFSQEILYSAINGDMHVFFTKKGIQISESYYETKTERNEKEVELREDQFNVNFMNASPNCRLISNGDLTATYGFTSQRLNGVKATKELIYEELYPGIDLIFTFDEKRYGIKYAFRLKPGADASQIQWKVPHADKAMIDERGRLHLFKGRSELIDERPSAVCEGKKIETSFNLRNNIISFTTSAYDQSKTLLIDPFLINPNFTNDNKAFDAGSDASGNVYAYGGQNPWKLKKFDNTGSLQWTAITTYSSYFGDLAVDGTGNSYISEGCCGGGLQKISPANSVLWNQNYGVQEFWCLCLNCDYSKLYTAQGWGGPPFQGKAISEVNISNGAPVSSSIVSTAEPRALCQSPAGNFYMLICTPGNSVVATDAQFNVNFSLVSNYSLAYNGPAYSNAPNNPTAGQNAIAAGSNFLCTSDGATIYKRNLISGVVISSLAIPGGTNGLNSGILIDNCDNIYAGSGDGTIYKYDANFNPVATATTGGAVYCIAPGVGGLILACGNGFVGTFQMNFSSSACYAAFSSSAGCTCTGSAGINVISPFANPTYSWNNGATTSSLGNLCPGNYTCNVTYGCNSQSFTFNIAGGANVNNTLNASQDTLCIPECATLTALGSGGTPPYTYLWQPNNVSGGTVVACPTVNTIYTCVVTDVNDCAYTSTIQIIVKDCSTFISEQIKNGNIFRLYPSVNDGSFYLESERGLGQSSVFELYTTKGEKLMEAVIPANEKTVRIQNNKLAQGMYSWRIISGNKNISSGKILVN